ncbi:MAG: aminopeptidase [Candidatus Sabulitectum sp.]|nr:aminopeptidase [Candidatus Sabulitectum sp.]
MNKELMKAYSEVILSGALKIKKGDVLWLRSEPVHLELARFMAETAYKLGAKYVNISMEDPAFARIRIDSTVDDCFLDYVPENRTPMFDSVVKEGWRSLALRGPAEPDLMEGVDSVKLARATKAASMARKGFLSAISSNKLPWNVCLAPTRAWAEKVLGSDEDWEDRIWDILIPILRLDRDDPVAAWLEHDAMLKRRAEFLNSHKFPKIRFSGPGTDLTIGMLPDRRFNGGSCTAADGTVFFPNIPTEEVFSTPDMTATEGKVRCTRPVTVYGAQVNGAWFRFEEGRVVESGAETNAHVLKQYLGTDEGASMLGEIALVGVDSPIYKSGKIFHNILFDENASCHIALGNGYTDCIDGGTKMDEEALRSCRCNQSLVHTDFMIGSEEVDVTGIAADGTETMIIKNGEFMI